MQAIQTPCSLISWGQNPCAVTKALSLLGQHPWYNSTLQNPALLAGRQAQNNQPRDQHTMLCITQHKRYLLLKELCCHDCHRPRRLCTLKLTAPLHSLHFYDHGGTSTPLRKLRKPSEPRHPSARGWWLAVSGPVYLSTLATPMQTGRTYHTSTSPDTSDKQQQSIHGLA